MKFRVVHLLSLALMAIAASCAVPLTGTDLTLTDFELGTNAINVTSAPQVVSCTLDISTTGAAVLDAGCVFASPSGKKTACVSRTDSGGGVFTCDAPFLQNAEAGTWSIVYAFARDVNGVSVRATNANLVAGSLPGVPNSAALDVAVTSTNEDVAGPSISAFTALPASVDPGDQVTCTVTATDSSAILDRGCTFRAPSTGAKLSCIARATTDACAFTVPLDAENGVWTEVNHFARDVLFNETRVSGSATFTVGTPASNDITGVWAQTGEDKVFLDELRENASPQTNSIWDGTKVSINGMKNEIVGFNLVLEAAGSAANTVTVTIDDLQEPGTNTIVFDENRTDPYDWTTTDIEIFYTRFLPIDGLSPISYVVDEFSASWRDERHVPPKFQRPHIGKDIIGADDEGWTDRPGHDRFVPEILEPIEAHPSFNIGAGENAQLWFDIYIPKTAVSDAVYSGDITITQGGVPITVPIELTVLPYTMPDVPSRSARAFTAIDSPDINDRHFGPSTRGNEDSTTQDLMWKYFAVLHRHRIDGVGFESHTVRASADIPRWVDRPDAARWPTYA